MPYYIFPRSSSDSTLITDRQHVVSATCGEASGLEIMPMLILIDGASTNGILYKQCTSGSRDKNEIHVHRNGREMLGMRLIYMDAGSGAKRAITESSMIRSVASILKSR